MLAVVPGAVADEVDPEGLVPYVNQGRDALECEIVVLGTDPIDVWVRPECFTPPDWNRVEEPDEGGGGGDGDGEGDSEGDGEGRAEESPESGEPP
ncbi:MAG: hypothetical protein ACT4PT_12630 [Methanobacteriota archaeon]